MVAVCWGHANLIKENKTLNSSTFVGFTFCCGTQLHHSKGCDIKHQIRDILKSTRVAFHEH